MIIDNIGNLNYWKTSLCQRMELCKHIYYEHNYLFRICYTNFKFFSSNQIPEFANMLKSFLQQIFIWVTFCHHSVIQIFSKRIIQNNLVNEKLLNFHSSLLECGLHCSHPYVHKEFSTFHKPKFSLKYSYPIKKAFPLISFHFGLGVLQLNQIEKMI